MIFFSPSLLKFRIFSFKSFTNLHLPVSMFCRVLSDWCLYFNSFFLTSEQIIGYFYNGRCCSFRRRHLFTELQGVLNPLISQLSPIVPTLNVSNYLFFEGNCSVKSEHENRHQYMSFTNSVLTETKI